jgi:hypothetical protein
MMACEPEGDGHLVQLLSLSLTGLGHDYSLSVRLQVTAADGR